MARYRRGKKSIYAGRSGDLMICHFEGESPYETNFDVITGDSKANRQATATGGVIGRPGKLGKGVQIAEAATSLVTNPSAEVDITGWNNISLDTFERITTDYYIGSACFRMADSSSNSAQRARTDYINITAELPYKLSVRIKKVTATGSGFLHIQAFTSGGSGVNEVYQSLGNGTHDWEEYTIAITPGATATKLRIDIFSLGLTNGTPFDIYFDAVKLEQTNYLTPYLDGSLGDGHSWSGTAHASTSSRTAAVVSWDNPLSMSEGSVAMWWQPADSSAGAQATRYLFSEGNIEAWYQASDDKFYMTNGTVTASTDAQTFSADTWMHLMFFWGTGFMRIYINGAQAAFVSAYTPPGAGANFFLGCDSSGANQCNGVIDELVIMDHAITSTERASLYAAADDYATGALKYGETAAQDTLSWAFEVDWDGDGVFDGSNEAYYLRSLSPKRGRDYTLKADGSGFEEIKSGEINATLDNSDGRFDPYNTDSPIYPYVSPGKMVRIRVLDDATGTIYNVFKGYITDIQPMAGDDERVVIKAVDGLEYLKEQDIQDELYSDVDVYDAIEAILTAAGWTESESVEDAGDNMPYWWTMDQNAREAINALANTYLGKAFVAADGTFTFYARHHDGTSEMTISQDQCRRAIAMPQPWEVVRNIIKVIAHPRRLYSTVELWRLQDTMYVGVGESVEIWANYQYNGESIPASNVVSPVATTDYTMNTASGGGGSDLTANFSVSMDDFAATAKLTVTNNGSQAGYITLLKLRGDALSSLNTVTIQREDDASKAIYSPRTLKLDLELLQDANIAVDFANLLRAKLANPQAYPMLEFIDRPSIQFTLDLFDVVTLDIEKKNISGEFDVASIQHEWLDESGQAVLTTLRFEPSDDLSNYWSFPTEIGETSIFAF